MVLHFSHPESLLIPKRNMSTATKTYNAWTHELHFPLEEFQLNKLSKELASRDLCQKSYFLEAVVIHHQWDFDKYWKRPGLPECKT